MFHTKDRNAGQLFDQWRYLGPKRRKLLNESWAGLFREQILPELPVAWISTEKSSPKSKMDFGGPGRSSGAKKDYSR